MNEPVINPNAVGGDAGTNAPDGTVTDNQPAPESNTQPPVTDNGAPQNAAEGADASSDQQTQSTDTAPDGGTPSTQGTADEPEPEFIQKIRERAQNLQNKLAQRGREAAQTQQQLEQIQRENEQLKQQLAAQQTQQTVPRYDQNQTQDPNAVDPRQGVDPRIGVNGDGSDDEAVQQIQQENMRLRQQLGNMQAEQGNFIEQLSDDPDLRAQQIQYNQSLLRDALLEFHGVETERQQRERHQQSVNRYTQLGIDDETAAQLVQLDNDASENPQALVESKQLFSHALSKAEQQAEARKQQLRDRTAVAQPNGQGAPPPQATTDASAIMKEVERIKALPTNDERMDALEELESKHDTEYIQRFLEHFQY